MSVKEKDRKTGPGEWSSLDGYINANRMTGGSMLN
jgi:hypothetical protein